MTEVVVNKSLNVAANKVWANISSFRGIEEWSPIEKSETTGNGAGAKRTCFINGAPIQETLNSVDDAKMELEYQIDQGPFPIEDYLSTIKVEAVGDDSCKVTWGCEYIPNAGAETEMENLFNGFYNGALEALEQLIKSN